MKSGNKLSVAVEATDGESEPRVFLVQEVSSTSVKRDGGKSEALPGSDFLKGETRRELADRVDEEVHVEEEEEEDQEEIYPQGCQTCERGGVN